MAIKGLIASVVQLLTQQLEDGDLSADSRESLEVAIQCLESAYNVQASDAQPNVDLLELYKSAVDNVKPDFGPPASPEAKAEAERLKNEGNSLMKAEKHHEALANYTKAIELDGRNAVYYCNRAAVHSKIGNHAQAIKDCNTALAIDPSYSKAYGRLGLAYSSLEKHKEAKQSYQKALEMEPGNESYKINLQLSEEKLAQQGVGYMVLGNNPAGSSGVSPNMDLSSLLSNPALRNMARLMLSDPGMQNMMSDLMSGNVEQGGRMEALIEAGQQLAQQMQSANPELIDSLRRQMGGNPNDPEPPREN
ncbi:small glutamine-rich tetratricopeptide repeat-containing protein alpha-like [Athalia rosae]|uniref:small glutamine-rich tetratricopeptide repeat-containing protein alpha-like n=1 Tax=Athalia rosae TaxID=37344 RepID=UPI000626DF50|nr:small glutamine-rich tetratricopeptide repeat-containing protein alpha-like [Athalia rosae]XP_048511822.1 small glutamine-rich tetratricopeptide repeat-containing protein alpha-like [Athalia rosae]